MKYKLTDEYSSGFNVDEKNNPTIQMREIQNKNIE